MLEKYDRVASKDVYKIVTKKTSRNQCVVNDLEVPQSQTQIMVEHENILSTVMLKNDKLANGKFRLHMAGQSLNDQLLYDEFQLK